VADKPGLLPIDVDNFVSARRQLGDLAASGEPRGILLGLDSGRVGAADMSTDVRESWKGDRTLGPQIKERRIRGLNNGMGNK
jgi:hypothetical protein